MTDRYDAALAEHQSELAIALTKINVFEDVLKLTVATLPALDRAKGYDKIGAVIVARATAALEIGK